jgi:hypothetical protein
MSAVEPTTVDQGSSSSRHMSRIVAYHSDRGRFPIAVLCCAIDSLFPRQGRWMFRAMADPPKYKFVDNLRPPCSGCGRPLILTRIEPEEPGFDLRTYYCAHCEAHETVIAPI